jgi:hypothetical protein
MPLQLDLQKQDLDSELAKVQNPNIQYYFINGKMYIYNKKLDIVNRYIRTGSVWCYNMKTQLGPNETINDYLCKQRLN